LKNIYVIGVKMELDIPQSTLILILSPFMIENRILATKISQSLSLKPFSLTVK